MGMFSNKNRWLGLFFFIFAVLLIFVWVPLDTDTGIAEKVRRKWTIGDALAPTVAGVILLFGSFFLLVVPGSDSTSLTRNNLKWCGLLFGLFVISTLIMRYAGPAIAAALTEEGYRPLRATIPWKYIGYMSGGTILVGGLAGLVRQKLRLSDWLIAFFAAVLIALAYDLPFDDLLLPPNADV